MITLQVEQTLFRVDLSALKKHSEPIRNIFEIPQSYEDEGTKTCPIFLDSFVVREFEAFLTCFDHMYVIFSSMES
jgi:hypothetical protein